MTEEIQLFGDRVIVEPIENPDINPGGVVYTGVPKSEFAGGEGVGKHKQICMGKVAFVGNGKRHPKTGRRRPVEVQPGQYITFSDSCHRPVKINNVEHRVLKESDIMTIHDSPPSDACLVY